MSYKKKYLKYKLKYLKLKKLKNSNINYGGMNTMIGMDNLLREQNSSDTIEINIKTENEEISINVSPENDVHETIKEYLNISLLKKLNISHGGIEIESSTSFEDNDIVEGAHISVIDDFCQIRWKNYNMLFSEYIKLLPLSVIYNYMKELKNINNYELEKNILSNKYVPILLQLIEDITGIDTTTATLCEVQNELFNYNILLPGDKYLTLLKELKDLYEEYEQCELVTQGEVRNRTITELDEHEKEIKKKMEELEKNE